MENINRPTLNETDDDLLVQQKTFLKEKLKPSVKWESNYSKKPNCSQEENDREAQKSDDSSSEKNNPIDLEVVVGDIIFDVKERDVSFVKPFVFQPPPLFAKELNQDLEKMDIKFTDKRRVKGKSIFAQLFNSSRHQNFKETEKENKNFPIMIDGSGLKLESKESEATTIHKENLAKLSQMSEEKILHEQEELKKYLADKNPKILDFIKKRKEMKNHESVKTASHQDAQNQKTDKISKGNEDDLPGKILRKEGKEDCDALILEKVLESENDKFSFQKTDASSKMRKTEDDSNIELPKEAKKLIKDSQRGLWKNMNKIEKEKLEWMTNLPPPKPVDLKSGYTARFDFEGKLLSREADIPTHEGLHHHGEEPEIAGYSLEELFLLARSSMQSQRITALNTVAHILENNWYGMMDSCFEAPLLPLLLNAGIVPLLRWALDDISLTSISATISAIHSLLISKADEACSNKAFCWLNGHFVAQLEPQDLEEPNVVLEELTDADLIKLDVIKGFLRIDILPRFMYILKVMCPPPLVCKLIIEILAHLAQHSPESAKQVATYPGLLNLIFEKFLPLTWHFVDSSTLTDSVDYSCPMHSALKLLRIIVSSNKELALVLIEKYDIIPILTFYLTVQPCDGKLTPLEVQLLVIETLKTWHSFLCYGLAFNLCLDLFPNFLKQLDFCLSLDINSDIHKHLHDFDYATHLFKSFEALTVVSAELKDDGQELASAINVIFTQALVCLRKWFWQFSQENTSSHGMTLLAACINFIVMHCKKSHDGLICENWKPCLAAKNTFEECLLAAIRSRNFQNVLQDFRSFSLYLNSELSGNKRDGKTIVSLGCVLYGEDIIPILKEGSPLPLLSAILNYILFYKNSFQDSGIECVEIVLCNSICEYLRAVSTKKLKNTCWFLKFETYFIYQLIQLASFGQVQAEVSLGYVTAVSVLPTFTSPEECLIEDLFETIIFKQSAIPKLASFLSSSESSEVDALHLLVSRLPVIAQCYISCFLNKKAILNSKNLMFRNTNIESLFCLSTPSSLISKDWCYKPLLYLYHEAKMRIEEGCLTPEEVLLVTSSLQWIVICHLLNLPVLRNIPASAEFYYLCLVFLLDENLFRDDKVKELLVQCSSFLLQNKTLNLHKINWNGIKTFDDIYLDMLIQYEAVSYGDETFGNFLAIPLQQCQPRHWKKLLLTEHTPVLRFLRLPLSKLLVPLQNFLEPVETDVELLSEYFGVLASGKCLGPQRTVKSIKEEKASGNLDPRCPLLHLMAVYHIHNFIFMKMDSHATDQKLLLLKILKSTMDLQKKLLLFLDVNINSEYGFTMASELSSERTQYIFDISGMHVDI